MGVVRGQGLGWSLLFLLSTGCLPNLPPFEDPAADADGDGVLAADDCDDTNDAVFPGATEVCNGIDDNCDLVVDDDAVDRPVWYDDVDHDGLGDPNASTTSCVQPTGTSSGNTDCDDNNATLPTSFFPDNDNDGYGSGSSPGHYGCEAPANMVSVVGDCNDGNAQVNPGALEVCNSEIPVDENCDGTYAPMTAWFADEDNDGYRAGGEGLPACVAPDATFLVVSDPLDCDDLDPRVNEPGLYIDTDLDNTGEFVAGGDICSSWRPPDCNDGNAAISPLMADAYNDGVDQDCSGHDYDVLLTGAVDLAAYTTIVDDVTIASDETVPAVTGFGARLAVSIGGTVYLLDLTPGDNSSLVKADGEIQGVNLSFGDRVVARDGFVWFGDATTNGIFTVDETAFSGTGLQSVGACQADSGTCEVVESCLFANPGVGAIVALSPGWMATPTALYQFGADCEVLTTINGFEGVTALTDVGDIDGDGVPDLAVTQQVGTDGSVEVVSGANVLRGAQERRSIDIKHVPLPARPGPVGGVAPHGDANRNGFGEIAVATTNNLGAVRVYDGAGLRHVDMVLLTTWLGPTAFPSGFGAGLVSLGDIDGIVGDELAVSAPMYRTDQTETGVRGAVFVFGTIGATTVYVESNAKRFLGVDARRPLTGDVWTVPDLDGDDRPELAVWQGGDEPRLYVLYGDDY